MSQQVLSNIVPSFDTVKTTLGMSPSIPKTCKAALFREKDAPLSIEEVPVNEPAAGEILIKVEACGVCHSDSVVVSTSSARCPTNGPRLMASISNLV